MAQFSHPCSQSPCHLHCARLASPRFCTFESAGYKGSCVREGTALALVGHDSIAETRAIPKVTGAVAGLSS